MKIDLISDIHLDHWDYVNITPFKLQQLHPNKDSDVLIIAGDLGHINKRIKSFLVECSKYYKQTLCVLGNHDHYCVGKYTETTPERVNDLRKIFNSFDNVKLLASEYFTVDDYTFYGYTGWYDGSYAFRHSQLLDQGINMLWYNVMNDSRLITDVNRYDDRRNAEKATPPTKKADIVITHCNPSTELENQVEKYRHDPVTGFYTFDGLDDLEILEPQLWVFGHTHTPNSYKIGETVFVCNPLGYPHEGTMRKIIQLEVLK